MTYAHTHCTPIAVKTLQVKTMKYTSPKREKEKLKDSSSPPDSFSLILQIAANVKHSKTSYRTTRLLENKLSPPIMIRVDKQFEDDSPIGDGMFSTTQYSSNMNSDCKQTQTKSTYTHTPLHQHNQMNEAFLLHTRCRSTHAWVAAYPNEDPTSDRAERSAQASLCVGLRVRLLTSVHPRLRSAVTHSSIHTFIIDSVHP